MKRYTAFVVGGEKDGMSIGSFNTLDEAIKFAKDFGRRHIAEFDVTWGGVAIFDETDEQIVEW